MSNKDEFDDSGRRNSILKEPTISFNQTREKKRRVSFGHSSQLITYSDSIHQSIESSSHSLQSKKIPLNDTAGKVNLTEVIKIMYTDASNVDDQNVVNIEKFDELVEMDHESFLNADSYMYADEDNSTMEITGNSISSENYADDFHSWQVSNNEKLVDDKSPNPIAEKYKGVDLSAERKRTSLGFFSPKAQGITRSFEKVDHLLNSQVSELSDEEIEENKSREDYTDYDQIVRKNKPHDEQTVHYQLMKPVKARNPLDKEKNKEKKPNKFQAGDCKKPLKEFLAQMRVSLPTAKHRSNKYERDKITSDLNIGSRTVKNKLMLYFKRLKDSEILSEKMQRLTENRENWISQEKMLESEIEKEGCEVFGYSDSVRNDLFKFSALKKAISSKELVENTLLKNDLISLENEVNAKKVKIYERVAANLEKINAQINQRNSDLYRDSLDISSGFDITSESNWKNLEENFSENIKKLTENLALKRKLNDITKWEPPEVQASQKKVKSFILYQADFWGISSANFQKNKIGICFSEGKCRLDVEFSENSVFSANLSFKGIEWDSGKIDSSEGGRKLAEGKKKGRDTQNNRVLNRKPQERVQDLPRVGEIRSEVLEKEKLGRFLKSNLNIAAFSELSEKIFHYFDWGKYALHAFKKRSGLIKNFHKFRIVCDEINAIENTLRKLFSESILAKDPVLIDVNRSFFGHTPPKIKKDHCFCHFWIVNSTGKHCNVWINFLALLELRIFFLTGKDGSKAAKKKNLEEGRELGRNRKEETNLLDYLLEKYAFLDFSDLNSGLEFSEINLALSQNSLSFSADPKLFYCRFFGRLLDTCGVSTKELPVLHNK